MCRVNITEFRNNISHYINLSKNEEVYVTKNGEIVAVLSNPKEAAFKKFMNMGGCLKAIDNGESYEDMIGEEVMKKCGF